MSANGPLIGYCKGTCINDVTFGFWFFWSSFTLVTVTHSLAPPPPSGHARYIFVKPQKGTENETSQKRMA